MSKNVGESPVEGAKSAVGPAAFATARAELAAQSAQDHEPPTAEPPADQPSTAQPTQEPAAAADESTETATTEDQILTADELAKLSPKERAQADKWQAKLTQKSQELAKQRKAIEQWQPLINNYQQDPKGTITYLAQQLGIPLAPAPTVREDVTTKFANAIDALPEELRPMFQPFADALAAGVLQSIEGRLQPIVDSQTQIISEAAAAETAGEIAAFKVKHPDMEKHEPEMLRWMQRFQPGPGVTAGDYLEAAYQSVTARMQQVDQIKSTVARINKIAETAEAPSVGVSEVQVEQTMPANWSQMTDKQRMRAAYEAAGKGIVWKK